MGNTLLYEITHEAQHGTDAESDVFAPDECFVQVDFETCSACRSVAAQLIGMAPGTLSDLELGKPKKALKRKRLEEMVEPLKAAPGAVEVALSAIDRIRPDERADSLAAYLPAELRADLENTAAAAGRMVLHDLHETARERAYEGERAHAETVWKVLQPLAKKPAVRRLVIERTPGFATWALVERLAHQSEKAAARDVEEALALGELGPTSSSLAPKRSLRRIRGRPAPSRALACSTAKRLFSERERSSPRLSRFRTWPSKRHAPPSWAFSGSTARPSFFRAAIRRVRLRRCRARSRPLTSGATLATN